MKFKTTQAQFLSFVFLGICRLCAASTLTTTFDYDAAGRLAAAAYSTGTNITYAYNLAGDLVKLSIAPPGAFADSNHNGIDDAWETQYFGNLSRDGSGDFDGDGMTDLAEYLAGTDPASAASALKITTITAPGGPQSAIEWNSTSGKTYRVQFKSNLGGPWLDLSGDVLADGASAAKVDSTAGDQATRFYRVLVLP